MDKSNRNVFFSFFKPSLRVMSACGHFKSPLGLLILGFSNLQIRDWSQKKVGHCPSNIVEFMEVSLKFEVGVFFLHFIYIKKNHISLSIIGGGRGGVSIKMDNVHLLRCFFLAPFPKEGLSSRIQIQEVLGSP